jgi:hypothetical protein
MEQLRINLGLLLEARPGCVVTGPEFVSSNVVREEIAVINRPCNFLFVDCIEECLS